ncbi:GDSL-like protein [Leptospira ryugenii]|uniref:GDSL-like protein n=1 Tax=Leptospira ryugenii TaxID=1917863 RepID=A0A2P2DZT8_9LEPT|nr:GDSL-type esterase/lipase family protein [Leptospira ryugenii]GBF50152.1 GDSL-like protein [Leptospira ryugenii]
MIKNSRPVFSKTSLFLFILSLLFSSCRTLRVKDYFHPDFTCLREAGWANQKDFKKYKELWTLKRIAFQADNQQTKQSRVVIVGNSLVFGFSPDLMKQELPGVNIVNRGIGGDMTETLLERIEEDVLSLSPEVVIIEIGGNDLIYGKCLSYSQDNTLAILDRIERKNPKTKVILIAVPPTLVPELNRIVPVFNLFLSETARNRKNVTYIEVWNEMRQKDAPVIDADFVRPNGDPIHFNERGYQVWGKKLRPLL